jgi:hypothetical protein
LSLWYENGQKMAEVSVVHGERDGVQTQWYEDGQKKSEINYVAGKQEGLTIEWDAVGNESRSCYNSDKKLDDVPQVASSIDDVCHREPDQIAQSDEPAEPASSIDSNVSGSSEDVTDGMLHGSVRFWDTAIQSVSDGTFSGNTAVVAPGASVRMTGNWQIGPVSDTSYCPGCNIQIYIAWVPDAAARGAWPPSRGLWKGMTRSVNPNLGPSGSFDWTSEAPTVSGLYYVGRGQTLDFAFKLKTQGKLGSPTAGPATVEAASFVIEARAKAAN